MKTYTLILSLFALVPAMVFSAQKLLTSEQLKKRDEVVAIALADLGGDAIQNKAVIKSRAQEIAAEHIKDNRKKLISRIVNELQNFVEPFEVTKNVQWGLNPEQVKKRDRIVAIALEELGGRNALQNREDVIAEAQNIASEFLGLEEKELVDRIVRSLRRSVYMPAVIKIDTILNNIAAHFIEYKTSHYATAYSIADVTNSFIGLIKKANNDQDSKTQQAAINQLVSILSDFIATLSTGSPQSQAFNAIRPTLDRLPIEYNLIDSDTARDYSTEEWREIWKENKPSQSLSLRITKELFKNSKIAAFLNKKM